jgi:hypothetical protein
MIVENLMVDDNHWSWQEKEYLSDEDRQPNKARIRRERQAFEEAEYGTENELI